MFKRAVVMALSASALTFSAPAAVAAEPVHDCGFNSVQQDDATGQNFEGVMYAYVIDVEGREVAIQCSIEVNGSEVASTPVGTGTAFASTSGRVTFAASDTDSVRHCRTIWIFGREVFKYCEETTTTQVPPQAFLDLVDTGFDVVDDAVRSYIDPTMCPALASASGMYGPVTINSQGDVFIEGEPYWDCPPYDIFAA